MTLQDLGFTSPLPLILITLVIGFILGWLITALPSRSRVSQMAVQAQELGAKLSESNRALAASQAREQELQSGFDATRGSLAEANGQLAVAQRDHAALAAEMAALQKDIAAAHHHEQELQAGLNTAGANLDHANAQAVAMQQALMTRDAELADLKLQQDAMRSTAQQSYGAFNSQVQSLQAELQRVCEENETLKASLEGTSADLAKVRMQLETATQTLGNKDTALTEAYARAVRLERESTEEQSEVLNLQAEIATLKRDLAMLTASNQELNGRLDNARGAVANELAVLTSTMLRVKDEQLAQANATITALQAQLAAPQGAASSTRSMAS